MTVWGTRIRGGFVLAVALAVAGWVFGIPNESFAHGLPAAQAEAQGDTGADPYTFPKINLCCERRSVSGGGSGGGGNGGWGPRPDDGDGSPRSVLVNCAMPTEPRRSFGSVQEALAFLRGAGTIFIAPGAPCEVSGLQLDGAVTIATDRYGYGARAKLVTAETCIAVSANRSSAPVTFGGLDIDGCISIGSGMVVVDEVNVAWRGPHAAISVGNGSLELRGSTVRARDTAIYAAAAGRVLIEGSRLATTPVGPYVIRIAAAAVQMTDLEVKGGLIGVLLDSVSEKLDLNKVNVIRTEPGDPYPPSKGGDAGIVIAGAQAMQDLPWLSGMDSRRVSIRAGSVTGYNVGISVGAGSSVVIEDMAVNGSGQGITVATGAVAELNRNRITGVLGTGINLESGSRGSARENKVQCVHGRCVCYGGDCSSRSNYTFGNGAFLMTDTDCDD